MSLYAFDGTWNDDEEAPELDTNVVRFLDFYDDGEGEKYVDGVGTRKGHFGKIIGGLTGAGGRTRIKEMLKQFEENFQAGDEDIDIIGFSRGAALALHFSNFLASHTFKTESGEKRTPRIRFLGLWDVVGSFGLPRGVLLPLQTINIGWKLQIPDNVDHCSHAMGLHERRQAFEVIRLDPKNTESHVDELWFRGCHSDIGGGNENVGRSNIALLWMLEQAVLNGLPINLEKMEELKEQTDRTAPIVQARDLIVTGFRKQRDGDRFHDSARSRKMRVSESVTLSVLSAEKLNWTGIWMDPSAHYQVKVPSGQTWVDDEIQCDESGWEIDDQAFRWIKKKFIESKEDNRRVPQANWFELCGTITADRSGHFVIGKRFQRNSFRPTREGEFYLFANDLEGKYDNNSGSLQVTVKRLK